MRTANHRFVTLPPVKWSKVNEIAGAAAIPSTIQLAGYRISRLKFWKGEGANEGMWKENPMTSMRPTPGQS
jgi:hypothetical protein